MSSKKKRVFYPTRVDEDTPDRLKAIALSLGFKYGNAGAVGKLLDAIAHGEIVLTVVKK